MHSNLFGSLVVVVAVLAFSHGADELEMSVKPEVIVESVAPKMTVDCRPGKDLSAPGIVGLMVDIIRSDVMGSEFLARQRLSTEVVDENRTSAEGHLHVSGDEEDTYLTVTIEEPSASDQGVFTCRFIYLDEKYEVKHLTVSTNITIYELPPPVAVELSVPVVEVIPEVKGDCECQEIRDEIHALKVNFVEENKRLRDQLHSYNDSCRVSFSASIVYPTLPITDGGRLNFDDVISNNGDAYDSSEYAFVAPCTGQYYLSLTLRSWIRYDSGHLEGFVIADGKEVARTASFTSQAEEYHLESSSNGVVVALKQGQKAHVITQTSTSGAAVLGEKNSIFSGFFVSP